MNNETPLLQADNRRLEQAAAANHQELFTLEALCAAGEVCTEAGVTWTFARKRKGIICFPAMTENNAGKQLDKIIAYYLNRRPHGVGCWSLAPAQPANLDMLMLARGFQPGWRPNWMALDMQEDMRQHPLPPGLVITADNHTSLVHLTDLPYTEADNMGITPLLLSARPDKVQRFIATLDEQVVAHSAVLLTDTAGLYNVGVIPSMRNRGIGKAIVLAACNYARQQGYRYATLNGTGRRMYEQIGFRWVGDGYTWWMKIKNLRENPPAPHLIKLAEAVASGDMEALSAFDSAPKRNMTNGMTWLELAAHFKQPAAARWLVSHGVRCSVRDAWRLGWREEASSILAADPSLVNERYGEWGVTLMHIAAETYDTELARLALSANPDLTIKETLYNSDAMGWVNHMQATAIKQLVDAYQAGRNE